MRENTVNPSPGKMTPSAEAVPPTSPKMVKFQTSDNAQ